MRKYFILVFLFFPLFAFSQPQNIDADDSVKQEENIKVLEYNNKPQKATFGTPLKLTFTLPDTAAFDGENTSQKDFEILSIVPNKQNPLLIEATVLPLNLQISTLTALGFITPGGEKLETENLEIDIEEIPSKITSLIDIRGPYRPFNIWPFIFIVLFIGLLIYAFIYFKKRKSKPQPLNLSPYQKQERPMHEIALSQLDILTQSDLWEKNQYKLYYSEISDILRQFLSARFNFEAQKMTARELFKKLKTVKDFKFDFNVFHKFQQELGLVKFARVVPSVEERDKTLLTAKAIILENKETDLSRYQAKDNLKGGGNEKHN